MDIIDTIYRVDKKVHNFESVGRFNTLGYIFDHLTSKRGSDIHQEN
jgi:hypothetical protein